MKLSYSVSFIFFKIYKYMYVFFRRWNELIMTKCLCWILWISLLYTMYICIDIQVFVCMSLLYMDLVTWSLYALSEIKMHCCYTIINLKDTFFDTAVGSRPNCARMCGRIETRLGISYINSDPTHPIRIETHSYPRPLYRPPLYRLQAAVDKSDNASLSFAFWGSSTLSTSMHRHYDESVGLHRIKQLTRGNNTIPYHIRRL